MSQPPYRPEDTQPGSWGPPPPAGSYQPPSYTRPSGVPQSPAHQYSADPYESQPYGQPYGEQPYGAQQYGTQPYPQQPYAQQPWGYPGYGAYGEPPRRGNGMAVAGFVLSFFGGLLGLIFSIIGLRRSSEPGRGGKGLAIAGIVISLVSMVFWGLVAAGVASSINDAGSSNPFDSTTNATGPSSPAPAPGTESIADACHVIVPAVTGLQADMQSSTSPADMVGKINSLADTVEQQGVASGDPAFTQDTANLAAQYRSLMKAAQSGQKPDFTALMKAAEQLGYDCAKAGVTA